MSTLFDRRDLLTRVASAHGWHLEPKSGETELYFTKPVGRKRDGRHLAVFLSVRGTIVFANTEKGRITGKDRLGQVLRELQFWHEPEKSVSESATSSSIVTSESREDQP